VAFASGGARPRRSWPQRLLIGAVAFSKRKAQAMDAGATPAGVAPAPAPMAKDGKPAVPDTEPPPKVAQKDTENRDLTFSIEVPAGATNVTQGERKEVTINLERGDSFKETVKLQFDAPKGLKIVPADTSVKTGWPGEYTHDATSCPKKPTSDTLIKKKPTPHRLPPRYFLPEVPQQTP
jgi:hypothetical protein